MSEENICLENLTPKQIVAKLDTYIVGQQKAKKAVAIALRIFIRYLCAIEIFIVNIYYLQR